MSKKTLLAIVGLLVVSAFCLAGCGKKDVTEEWGYAHDQSTPVLSFYKEGNAKYHDKDYKSYEITDKVIRLTDDKGNVTEIKYYDEKEKGTGQAVTLEEAEDKLDTYKIFVQTTPAGMSTGSFALPFSLKKFPEGAIAADIVYNPLMTPFLLAAEQKGAKIVNGLGMFVHQGAIAYEHWLASYPNTNGTIARLTEQLGGK